MTRTCVALAIACAAQAEIAVAQRPNFTGTWMLDTAATQVTGGGRGDRSGAASGGGGRAGGGLGLGQPPITLHIAHDSVAFRVTELRADTDSVTIAYRIDGRRVTAPIVLGRGRGDNATYSARWDRNRLVTTIVRRLENRGGTVTLEYRETRSLTADSAMVVETVFVGRPGGRSATYRRTKAD